MSPATIVKTLEWRESSRHRTWDHADVARSSLMHDKPSLDVRLRYAEGMYLIEMAGYGNEK